MSAQIQTWNYLTAEEYLRQERLAESKSEYVNGSVYAMSGASLNHNRIAGNVFVSLSNQLRGRPCEVFSSDMKVQIDRANTFRYPDVSGLCGPLSFYDDVTDAYQNPALIVEVLSPSTEKFDREEKFNLYRLLDSLQEYVLIRQDRMEVTVFTRDTDKRWPPPTVYTADQNSVPLKSLGCSLILRDIYEKVTFQ